MTLAQGLAALRSAEAVLASAERGETVRLGPARTARSAVRVVVVALGKIGLPLAAHVARAGHAVVGCDVDPRVCELVNAARAPFPGEAGLEEALAEVVGDGRLRAQTDTAAAVAEGADLVIAVPPLVVDAEAQPDWRILDSVVADVARGLRAAADAGRSGTVVCVETTLPVGTTRTRISPALAAGQRAGGGARLLRRVQPGARLQRADLRGPRADTRSSSAAARRPARRARSSCTARSSSRPPRCGRWARPRRPSWRSSPRRPTATSTSRSRTSWRATPTASASTCDRVIDAANSQPFSHIHRPGVAVGGHCIPVYPHFFLHGAPEARLPAVAREVNGAMPAYAVELLADALGELDGARVLILGVAYRGGVKETAFSGAFPLRDALAARGATVVAADPLYDDAELARSASRRGTAARSTARSCRPTTPTTAR